VTFHARASACAKTSHRKYIFGGIIDMSREVEMTEKTVMTTDTSCGSLNTQAYDLKSHACSLPQPILKKAAYAGSNKQELIKAVSQSLMDRPVLARDDRTIHGDERRT
jgi:hypothetical protein